MKMRDYKRIDRLCDLLKEKWKIVPDQRLGQFLLNYVFGTRTPHDSYIFYLEDDIILKRLSQLSEKSIGIDRELVELKIMELLKENSSGLTESAIKDCLRSETITDFSVEMGLMLLSEMGVLQEVDDEDESYWVVI